MAPQYPIPHNESWEVLDSTKLKTFDSCKRQFLWNYLLGWRKDAAAYHLEFGKAWHKAMEVFYREGMKAEQVLKAQEEFLRAYDKKLKLDFPYHKTKTAEAALKGLVRYAGLYAHDLARYEVIDVETRGLVPIDNTGRFLAYTMDVALATENNHAFILEHKTTTNFSPWWKRQWELDIQIGTYTHAQYSIWPTYDRHGVTVNGAGFGAKQVDFERISCHRSKGHMANWFSTVNNLWDEYEHHLRLLEACSPEDECLNAFHGSPGACNNYGGCDYHELCSTIANPLKVANKVQPGFSIEFWNPLEEH